MRPTEVVRQALTFMARNRSNDGDFGGGSFRGSSGDEPTVPQDPSSRPVPAKNSLDADVCGQVLGGKYRVGRLIGRGASGSVYEAVDVGLGVKVAVKVLTHDAAGDPHSVEQFLEEAQLLTLLDNPYVVRWITFDKAPGGRPYLVMEFLRGQELSVLLRKEGRLPFARAAKLLLMMLEALEAAHFLPDGRFILHLDLKPANVFVIDGQQESVKVIDFGISQHIGAVARSARSRGESGLEGVGHVDLGATISAVRSKDDEGKVRGKLVVRARGGTISYASPEQCTHLLCDGEIVSLDGRADIYSLGIIAFEMLAGHLPWPAKSADEAVAAHRTKPVPRLASLGVKAPSAFQKFLDRCLAKNREDRFADVREARQALRRIVQPPPKLPVFAVALLLIATCIIWWQSSRPIVSRSLVVTESWLCTGPGKRHATTGVEQIGGDRSDGPGEQDAVVLSSGTRASDLLPLDGWSAKVDVQLGRASLEFVGDNPPRKAWQRVLLEAEGGQRSGEFNLIYIGPADWEAGEVELVPHSDGGAIGLPATGVHLMLVDPASYKLRTSIVTAIEGFDSRCIESVTASLGGSREIGLVRVKVGHRDVWEIDLSRLCSLVTLGWSPTTLSIRAVDRALNERVWTRSIKRDTIQPVVESGLHMWSWRQAPDGGDVLIEHLCRDNDEVATCSAVMIARDGALDLDVSSHGDMWTVHAPHGVRDGSYSIEFSCADKSGNRAVPMLSHELVIASSAPVVALRDPGMAEWSTFDRGEFRVDFEAVDGNGLRNFEILVDGKVVHEGLYENRMGSFRLSSSLGGQKVRLVIRVSDGSGAWGESAPTIVRIGRFEPWLPKLVKDTRDGNAQMRLVRGADEYCFGGQGEDFQALSPESRQLLGNAAGKRFGGHVKIPSFYLDCSEVSVRQLRRFLMHETCDLPGRDLVMSRLPVDETSPAIVDIATAEAYARWSGKRLLSPQEWEYAVRSGTDYRFWSSDGKSRATRKREDWVILSERIRDARRDPGKVPWAGGADEALGLAEGVLGLCSSPQEWLLDREGRLFVTGRLPFFFAWSDVPDPDQYLEIWRLEGLAFRCVLDADTVEEDLAKPSRRFLSEDKR